MSKGDAGGRHSVIRKIFFAVSQPRYKTNNPAMRSRTWGLL
jgi:hypothetical protein